MNMKTKLESTCNLEMRPVRASPAWRCPHHSSTPTPSYTHQDEQAESQAPEEKPTQQEEEEAPDDSHLDIRGERELQPYNILKARTVCMDELRILYAMVNKIKIAPVKEMVRQWL